MLLKKGSGSKY